jgi:hypothetical protein
VRQIEHVFGECNESIVLDETLIAVTQRDRKTARFEIQDTLGLCRNVWTGVIVLLNAKTFTYNVLVFGSNTYCHIGDSLMSIERT